MMSEQVQNVDHSALNTNQGMIIGLLITAFVLNRIWLVGLVAFVMLLGTVFKKPGFGFVYTRFLKPLGLARTNILRDNPEPHRFAQGFGGTVLVGSTAVFLLGAPFIGWALVWLVAALAGLNLFGGFCVGCAIYYWLNRLNVPGFIKAPPAGTFPGMRPKVR